MNDYEKLEYIHAALQESDDTMREQALAFVEELREPLMPLDYNELDRAMKDAYGRQRART